MRLNEKEFMEDHFAAVKFWAMRKSSYPRLSEICFRLYAIPVSSCSSERFFSAVKRIVTNDRSRLQSDILQDILIVRSASMKSNVE